MVSVSNISGALLWARSATGAEIRGGRDVGPLRRTPIPADEATDNVFLDTSRRVDAQLRYPRSVVQNPTGGGRGRDAAELRSPAELRANDRRALQELQSRDAEVRQHEAAHMAAGGGLTGGVRYDFVLGPDNRLYAVGGEVSIRLERGASPEQTIRNARQVRAAALAPAAPSAQDLAVANAAAGLEAEAVRERLDLALRAEKLAPGEVMGRATRAGDGRRQAAGPSSSVSVELELQSERLSARGASTHLHSSSSCGFCALAVSRYR